MTGGKGGLSMLPGGKGGLSMLRDLARPFPPKYIHGNPSGGGTYVKHHVVEQRLIQVLGLPPSFKMIEILRGDVAAIAPNPNGRSQRAVSGSPALTNVVVGVIAQMVAHLGNEPVINQTVVVQEAGDCEEPHNWKTDGARLKDAMSDAYKRCAMRLGCGLHLWSQDEYFLYDKLLEEAEGTQEVTPPSGGPSRPGAAPAPSAPPTTHLDTAETRATDYSAKAWVELLVKQYGENAVAAVAKAVAPKLNHRIQSFDSLSRWPVPDIMELAKALEPTVAGNDHFLNPDAGQLAAGSVSGTDAGGEGPPPPGTPSPEEFLNLIHQAKEAQLIGFSDIAKHSAVFLKADSKPPTTWGQLASAPPEALAELVSVLNLRERVDPKQGSLT